MKDDDGIKGKLAPENLAREGLNIGASAGLGELGGKVSDAVGGGILGDGASAAVKKVGSGIAGAIIDKLISGPPIEPVSYDVKINHGPDLDWHVREFHLVEELSRPYRLTLDLLTEDVDGVFNVDELLGADVVLAYGRNGVFRTVCGVIERVATLDVAAERLKVRIHAVPALHSLGLRVDTRLFQDEEVPKILDEVLGAALGEYGRKVDASRLNDTYLPRDYCVQFKESDLEFCHRLMEEEGISYFFDVGEGQEVETLVLADQDAARPNEDFPQVVAVIDECVPIIRDRPDTADTESIQQLEWTRPERTTKVTTRQFNWKRPDVEDPPEAEAGKGDERGRVRELYVPDARRRIEDKGGDDAYEGTEIEQDERPKTDKALEMLHVEEAFGSGGSNVTGFRAGGLFEIDDHPHPDVAQAKLLLTRVEHFGECPEQEIGAGADASRYENTFGCVPGTAVFRPSMRAPKPKVYGAQTATVTGPPGEEIHTDAHGRIKVKFHWDRLSPTDHTSSCWVRVAQMWGGAGWGTFFLPRIGMEVVVQFLDGNPDRPLVVGCVYNGANEPPYPLPEKKTVTAIKSNSSIGGGGFNELRFEDLKDAEQIYMHAQKDLQEEVLNNRSRSVGNDEMVSVAGNRSVTVGGSPSESSEGDFKGQMVGVTGDHSLTASKSISNAAKDAIRLTVGDGQGKPTSTTILPASITLQTAGGLCIRMDDESNTISLSTGKGATINMTGKFIWLN